MAHSKCQRGFETTLAFLRCELSKAHLFIPALYLSLLHTIRSAKGKPVFLLCEITQDTLLQQLAFLCLCPAPPVEEQNAAEDSHIVDNN